MLLAAQFNVADQIAITAVFVISLNLLMGVAGQASIAPAAFGAVGGYAAALVSIHLHFPFLAAVAAAALVSGAAGALVALPALRLSGDYLILLTLAVSYVVLALAASLPGLGGEFGLFGVPAMSLAGHQLFTPTARFPLLVAIALLSLGFAGRISRSGHGRILRALREDELAARSLGRPTVRLKVTVFGLSSGLAGVAGALLVYYDQIVAPAQFDLTVSISVITMMVVGGSGSMMGSVAGATLIGVSTPALEDVVRLQPGTAQNVQSLVFGVLLMAIVLFRPQGLIPERNSLRSSRRFLAIASAHRPEPSNAADVTAPPHRRANAVAEPTDASAAELRARDLVKRFGGVTALAGVDLELPPLRVTALIGPNGAGKSTLFRILTGDMLPDAGTVTLQGTDILGKSPDQVAGLGVVRSFQDVRLFRHLSALDNVMAAIPHQQAESVWRLFLLPRAASRDEGRCREIALEQLDYVGLGQKGALSAGELSYAEQKLVAIARALATGARILLLDEPTSGVDSGSLSRIAGVIRSLPELGRTVCIVEHNLAFLEMLDCPCLFMEAGRISAEGRLDDLMSQAELREAYFGNRPVAP
jgi:branched-chain amino acid transport system permease protein